MTRVPEEGPRGAAGAPGRPRPLCPGPSPCSVCWSRRRRVGAGEGHAPSPGLAPRVTDSPGSGAGPGPGPRASSVLGGGERQTRGSGLRGHPPAGPRSTGWPEGMRRAVRGRHCSGSGSPPVKRGPGPSLRPQLYLEARASERKRSSRPGFRNRVRAPLHKAPPSKWEPRSAPRVGLPAP